MYGMTLALKGQFQDTGATPPAFSLIVCWRLHVSASSWQKNPGMTLAIQTAGEMLMPNSEHLLGCMAPDQGGCERMLIELKTPDKT
ncbi:hypothetical protein P0D73_17775 [Paraburkholderia sp. RL18-101-BIB-B]